MVVVLLLLFSAAVTSAAAAAAVTAPAAIKKPAVLKFKVPKPGVFVPAGQPITVVGASMEPNATAQQCTVGLKTNAGSYASTQGNGPPGRTYVNWTGQTAPLQPGLNVIEAELICYHAGTGNVVVKHITHNVMASSVGGTASTSSTLPPIVAPSLPTTTTTPHKPTAAANATTLPPGLGK